MVNRTVKGIVLALALILASALPAAAQAPAPAVGSTQVGFGLVLGSIGAGVDFGKVMREMTGGKTMGWRGEVTFNREGCGSGLVDCGSATFITATGGLEFSGPIGTNPKMRWHGGATIGIGRFSYSDDFGACDLLDDLDLGDCNSTDVIFIPNGGFAYGMNDTTDFWVNVGVVAGSGLSDGRLILGIRKKM